MSLSMQAPNQPYTLLHHWLSLVMLASAIKLVLSAARMLKEHSNQHHYQLKQPAACLTQWSMSVPVALRLAQLLPCTSTCRLHRLLVRQHLSAHCHLLTCQNGNNSMASVVLGLLGLSRTDLLFISVTVATPIAGLAAALRTKHSSTWQEPPIYCAHLHAYNRDAFHSG
jgi:hypothetical protein